MRRKMSSNNEKEIHPKIHYINNVAIISPISSQIDQIDESSPSADDQQQQNGMPPFRTLFLFTGLYFADEKQPYWRAFKLFIVFLFIGTTFAHQALFIDMIIEYGRNPVLAFIILMANTHSAIVQIFFYFLQFRGHLPILMEMLASSNVSRRRIRTIFWQTFVIGFVVFICSDAFDGFNFYLTHTGKARYEDARSMMRKVEWIRTAILMMADFYRADYINLTIMVLFNVLIRVLIDELNQLNERIKEGAINEKGLAEICAHYLGIVRRVRQIDSIFQVFLFLIISTNIPMTVSTLLRLLNRLNNWNWLQFSIIMADLMGVLFELIGLTAMASVLHSKLAEVPANLIEQHKVHEVIGKSPTPHNHYHCLLSRISAQSDLGISLWGFTIISKPLILTVLSLMVTYLTVVLQFFRKKY